MSLIILLGQGEPAPPAPTGLSYMLSLLVELDLGDFVGGAKLDDDETAQLDTALLEYTEPLYATDISAYVRSAPTDRGASRELERVEAGTGTVVLDNRDGRFTPYNASSPYYPKILPMRRIRIRATWGAFSYPVLTGFVEAWPVGFREKGKDQFSPVRIVDGFKVLAQAAVSGSFPEQSSGARIAAILEAAGWPSPLTDIDTGLSTVPAIDLENVAALEHIQKIERAEGGRFFMARNGDATFRDRSTGNQPDLSARTWADDGTGMSYRDITLVFDDTLIANDIRLTRTGGTEQVATDFASQAKYGKRSYVESDLQLTGDSEVADLGDLLLERYAEPVLRVEGLVDNAMRHELWDRVLARDINDVVQVIEKQTGVAQVSLIEGISHDIAGDTWTVTLRLSPTTVTQAGILDDSTYGLLDSTAILAR